MSQREDIIRAAMGTLWGLDVTPEEYASFLREKDGEA